MDAASGEVGALQNLLRQSKELLGLDLRADTYTEMLEAYCEAVDQCLTLDLTGTRDYDSGKDSSVLHQLVGEIVENHKLVLERAIQAKEGVASDLAKLRRTKRGMIAYLSQSIDTGTK